MKATENRRRQWIRDAVGIATEMLLILAAIFVPLKIGDYAITGILGLTGPYPLIALWCTGMFALCVLGLAICLLILIGMAIVALWRKASGQ